MHAVQFEIGKTIIRNKGTKLWNDLPDDIKQITSLLLFKFRLKCYMLQLLEQLLYKYYIYHRLISENFNRMYIKLCALCQFKIFIIIIYIYFFSFFVFFSVIILHVMFIVIMVWAASIDGHLSSLVACHCTDLYLCNLFVHLANKLSLSLSPKFGLIIASYLSL